MMNFIERDPDFGYDLDAEYEYEDAQEEHDDYEEYQYEAEYAHCPGCGDEDEVLMEHNERNGRFRCKCNVCGMEGNFAYDPDEAAENWNAGRYVIFDDVLGRLYPMTADDLNKAFESSKNWWDAVILQKHEEEFQRKRHKKGA